MCHFRQTACHVMAGPADSIPEALRGKAQLEQLTWTSQLWDLEWGVWINPVVRPLSKAQSKQCRHKAVVISVHWAQHLPGLRLTPKSSIRSNLGDSSLMESSEPLFDYVRFVLFFFSHLVVILRFPLIVFYASLNHVRQLCYSESWFEILVKVYFVVLLSPF